MYDAPRRRGMDGMPPIVKNIIIINVILVLAQQVLFQSFGIQLANYLGLHYFRSDLFKPWQLVTYMFMHGDPSDLGQTLMHIFFNMFGLWMLGSILELRWGPKRFLIFYLVCGIGAALCQMGVQSLQFEPTMDSYRLFLGNPTLAQFESFVRHNPPNGVDNVIIRRVNELFANWMQNPGDLSAPKFAMQVTREYLYGVKAAGGHIEGMFDGSMVGASGSVFGVLFAFGYLFPNLELLLLFPPIPIKAKWFVLIYTLVELFAGIQNDPTDNVAHFAHLGGMLFAFLLLRLWRYRFGDR